MCVSKFIKNISSYNLTFFIEMEGRNGIENASHDSVTVSLAKFFLKSHSFKSLLFKDNQQEFYKIIKSGDQVSKLMFPLVVQAIKTGSRADQVYLENSDLDYMYEVGPLVVGSRQDKSVPATGLFFNSTGNAGFYTICDRKGGHIYPIAMQSKVAPMIQEVKRLASLEKTSAALPSERKTISPGSVKIPKLPWNGKDGEDKDTVIALKCQEWPEDIWRRYEDRNSSAYFDMQKLKGDYIYSIFEFDSSVLKYMCE